MRVLAARNPILKFIKFKKSPKATAQSGGNVKALLSIEEYFSANKIEKNIPKAIKRIIEPISKKMALTSPAPPKTPSTTGYPRNPELNIVDVMTTLQRVLLE